MIPTPTVMFAVWAAWSPWLPFPWWRLIHAVEVAFESIHVIGPEPAELGQPGIEFLEWFRFEPVEAALSVHHGLHETGLAQHSQVL